MHNVKKKGFTLIELIAVLVIMAIIALIVTPLVMNIIRKTRISADRRSIDAYGRSIELAIASYLLDTGKFPTEVSQLTIEYSGNKVECTTTQINPDSSAYLAGCKVNNREVSNYTYGSDKTPKIYNVGDIVTYNDIDFYVIENSSVNDNTVKLIKKTSLTTEEVNTYGGVGTSDNHVNKYTSESQGTAKDVSGYGAMAYYTSVDCGNGAGSNDTSSGCKNDYESSDVKYVIDNWIASNFESSKIADSRLVTYNELLPLTQKQIVSAPWGNVEMDVLIYDWLCGDYWIYKPSGNLDMGLMGNNGTFGNTLVFVSLNQVRPVVELYKSALN